MLNKLCGSVGWGGPCLLFFLLLHKGCGNIYLMALGAAIPLGYGLVSAYKTGSYVRIVGIIACCLLLLLHWPLVHLWGYWAFVAALFVWQDRQKIATIGSFAGLWVIQDTPIGSWTVLPIISLVTFLGFYGLGCLIPRFALLTMACAATLTGYEIYQIGFNYPKIEIAQDSSSPKGYTPGPTLAAIVHGKVTGPGTVGGDIGISSLIFDSGPYFASRQILLVEHDVSPGELGDVIRPGNARQREPWFENQFLGNQYLLEAIAQDGFLAFNLGGSLRLTGQLLLVSLNHESDQIITPLVIKEGNRTVVQDSDAFVDRLACRQENVVKEIVRGRIEPRLLNLSLLFIAITPLTSVYSFIGWLLPIVLVLIGLWMPRQGEVRIVGPIGWPHEPSKISGLITSINDSGFNWRIGTSNARILAIASGNQAVRCAEELVILEPGAVVKIGGHVIRAGTLPLTVVNGILDARELEIDGVKADLGIVIEGAKVVATGSPSKLNWRAYLDEN